MVITHSFLCKENEFYQSSESEFHRNLHFCKNFINFSLTKINFHLDDYAPTTLISYELYDFGVWRSEPVTSDSNPEYQCAKIWLLPTGIHLYNVLRSSVWKKSSIILLTRSI